MRASSRSAARNGQSFDAMKTRPCRSSTAYGTPLRAAPTYRPEPGLPSAKFAGLTRRGCFEMYSRISFLSQMWFPPVSTSMPAANNSSAIRGVMPNPAAEFSPLAMTRSIWRVSTMSASRSATIPRPGEPTMSPINRIFICSLCQALRLCAGRVRRSCLRKNTLQGYTRFHKKWRGPLRRVGLDPEPPV